MTERISIAQQREMGGLANLRSSGSGRGLRDIAEAAAVKAEKAQDDVLGAGEGEPLTLRLAMPPSANRYWRNFRGITVISSEAKAYKAAAAISAREQGAICLSCPVAVTVWVYRGRKSGDLDNRLKVILDSLSGVAYEDDRQIVELHAYRFDDAGNARVEVQVTEAK